MTQTRVLRLAAFVTAMAVLGACPKKEPEGPPPKPPVPVKIAEVTEQSMPVQLEEIGAVEAYSTIQVKAQISGELTGVGFKEGDIVEKDQVLFTIDARPYEVALAQAQANLAKTEAQVEQAKAMLAKDKTQAENAQLQLQRDAELLPKKMVSKEEYDSVRTAAEGAKLAVDADEATVKSSAESVRVAQTNIDSAKLQLEYCTIRSPIKGRTGSLLIYQGNLVKANDTTAMVVITQIAPIYATFTTPEKNLSLIRERMAKGALQVHALIPQQEDQPAIGTLTFIDNTVDRNNTGTIRLKATFENADGRLWPGQYVNVVIELSVQSNAIVAPTAAIETGQDGTYAYVIKPDMTAELRKVTVADTKGDRSVITQGLEPGEKVVIDGQVRLTPGATVKPVSEGTDEGTKPE